MIAVPSAVARPTRSDIEEKGLNLAEQLGVGGQGRVHRVADRTPPQVFKQYLIPGADARALQDLVELPATLGPAERDRLLRQTAWPLARVLNKGSVSGFLMQEIPGTFFGHNRAGTRKARELQFLLYEPSLLWGSIAPPDISGRRRSRANSPRLFIFCTQLRSCSGTCR